MNNTAILNTGILASSLLGLALSASPSLWALTPPALQLTDNNGNIVSIDSTGTVIFSGSCNALTCVTGPADPSPGQGCTKMGPGCVVWSGTIGAFKVSRLVGRTKPSLAPPNIDIGLGSVSTLESGGSGTLTISFTDIGFDGAGPTTMNETTSLLVGTGNVNYTSYLDSNNTPFGTATLVGTTGPMTHNSVLSGAGPSAQPFSMTSVETITLGAGSFLLNDFSLQATPPPPLSLACASSTGQQGHLSTSGLIANGGFAPYTFSILAGTLPAGLVLNPSGLITGAPTASGTFNFTAQVVDSSGNSTINTVQKSCSITVTPPPACLIPPSGTAIGGSPVSWNKFNTQGANNVVWIHAHIGKPSGVSTSTVTTVDFTGVTFVLNGKTYALPDGRLVFDPAASSIPAATFDAVNGRWTTILNPNNLPDEIFFDGNAVPVDSTITGGGQSTFNFTTQSNDSKLAFSWQWSAAAYTFWPGNSQAQILPYHQGDHAGTPENKQVQASLIQGPRGGGGSNFTGSWSGTGHGTCP